MEMYKEWIKEAVNKWTSCPCLALNQYKTLASNYPEGAPSFWKTKRFEHLEKTKDTSMLGYTWVNSSCPDLLKMDLVTILNQAVVDNYNNTVIYGALEQSKKDEFAKNDIDNFFHYWLEFVAIDAIVNDLSSPIKDKDFKSHLNTPDSENLLIGLKKIFKGKKGKSIAIMILALTDCKMISYNEREELYSAIRNEFGDIGTSAGINKYLADPTKIQSVVVDGFIAKIKSI